ncbi:glutamyl-tRNA reductase [Deinococcus lacus]|uniref:Glutamyl-tRNA reductase n=1 Tax=Deinococcus lacus TaxID=392561 RepID=A0ABW1YFA1_9DEIO
MTLSCPTGKELLRAHMVQPAPLDLAVVGLNHQTAPVEVREGAAVRAGSEEEVYRYFAAYAQEVMVLATCNRTEVYLAGLLGDPLRAFGEAWGGSFREHLYVYRGDAAAAHLYRVAAGLDSLVLGETQIQGQVKRAWQLSHGHGWSGTVLNKVAQGALAAGKRIRTETGLSERVVSVSSAAVELAQGILGGLESRTALIIGAGETAELTLTHLRAAGVQNVIVVNRTVERARQLAEKLGGQACASEYLSEVLPQADVVIASSAAPHYVLNGPEVAAALLGRPQRPMFLFDISVPRILAPDIAQVPGAHLYNLDDLTDLVNRNLQSRFAALPHAEAIVREAAADLSRWHLTRNAQQARAGAVGARLAVAGD